jgi:3-oxoacyl-[acyl-carrier protein] reductase
MTGELTGKVAIVTGSGRNIGRAIALALADDGASVVVNARSNRDEAKAVAREIETVGPKALVHVGDIADPASVQDRHPRQQRGVAAGKAVCGNDLCRLA